jgi:hypothetical protein
MGVVPLHAVVQLPQCAGSPRLASHPFEADPSQSAKPGAHAMPHVIAVHAGDAFGAVAQAVPHAPQFIGSFARSISHPFDALWSQSANPASHSVTEHEPAAQRSVA